MEIYQWKKNKNGEDKDIGRVDGMMIQVSPEEAMQLIKSLAAQLHSKSPNQGREEMRTSKNEYFSVAVHYPDIIKPEEREIDYIYRSIERDAKWKQKGDLTLNGEFLH